jgi:hypothetical protein
MNVSEGQFRIRIKDDLWERLKAVDPNSPDSDQISPVTDFTTANHIIGHYLAIGNGKVTRNDYDIQTLCAVHGWASTVPPHPYCKYCYEDTVRSIITKVKGL